MKINGIEKQTIVTLSSMDELPGVIAEHIANLATNEEISKMKLETGFDHIEKRNVIRLFITTFDGEKRGVNVGESCD